MCQNDTSSTVAQLLLLLSEKPMREATDVLEHLNQMPTHQSEHVVGGHILQEEKLAPSVQ